MSVRLCVCVVTLVFVFVQLPPFRFSVFYFVSFCVFSFPPYCCVLHGTSPFRLRLFYVFRFCFIGLLRLSKSISNSAITTHLTDSLLVVYTLLFLPLKTLIVQSYAHATLSLSLGGERRTAMSFGQIKAVIGPLPANSQYTWGTLWDVPALNAPCGAFLLSLLCCGICALAVTHKTLF